MQRARRIFELELKRGCDDHAVIGGLDSFLARAGQEPDVSALLEKGPKLANGYGALTPATRDTWLRALLEGKKVSTGVKASGNEGRAAPGRAKLSGQTVASYDPDTPAVEAKPKRAPRKLTAVAPPADEPVDVVDTRVTAVRGVKEGLQARLASMGLVTVRDLLYLFPNRHSDFANVRPIAELVINQEQTTVVSVWNASKVRLGKRDGTQAVVGDETGTMRIVFFNQPFLADQLKTNDQIVLSGKVGIYNGQRTMENPEWERLTRGEDLTHTGRLVPVYPLSQGLTQRVLRRIVKEAVDRYAQRVTDPLPADILERHHLVPLSVAIQQMHYPESEPAHESARRRIAFDELICTQLAVLERRLAWQEGRGIAFDVGETLRAYKASLPFALTGAQERVIGEVTADVTSTRPMARLLQGDVGSGKTAVAGALLTLAVANGYQGAIMAPTEILAEQHFKTLSKLLTNTRVEGRPLRIEMITGSQTGAVKRASVEALAGGEIDIAVGTHALIQEGVAFARLGAAVVDEQHRFGVMQRAALRERVVNGGRQTPHLLVMSATPIPRTLALTLFGDLDVSVIDEMPPGRLPISTHWVPPEERPNAYDFVRDQVRQGRQAFVVCPLIEESAAVQSRAATQEFERLSRVVFPELRLALLHGRMAAAEKDAVLDQFRRGETHILVATTVIEVGIDIPNASVMLIEGADRFGLAQMHQLRGRVGRGADQSFCLLLSDDPGYGARQRLKLLEDTTDGFMLAEADLRLRGPGDYFGTRQSGLPEFQAASFADIGLVETARREAMALLESDPGLLAPEHEPLARAVARAKRTVSGEVS